MVESIRHHSPIRRGEDLILSYSSDQVRRSAIDFLEQFRARAGDDYLTLVGDISLGLWSGREETTDPAAWTDWLECMWRSKGYAFDSITSYGLVELRVDGGRALSVEVRPGENSRVLTGDAVREGDFTELEGLAKLREFVNSHVDAVPTVTQLMEKLRRSVDLK